MLRSHCLTSPFVVACSRHVVISSRTRVSQARKTATSREQGDDLIGSKSVPTSLQKSLYAERRGRVRPGGFWLRSKEAGIDALRRRLAGESRSRSPQASGSTERPIP